MKKRIIITALSLIAVMILASSMVSCVTAGRIIGEGVASVVETAKDSAKAFVEGFKEGRAEANKKRLIGKYTDDLNDPHFYYEFCEDGIFVMISADDPSDRSKLCTYSIDPDHPEKIVFADSNEPVEFMFGKDEDNNEILVLFAWDENATFQDRLTFYRIK